MTEHTLQKSLTAKWSRDGIVLANGERLLLWAWEVMAPSWRINDARLGWGEPALDFLSVDEQGRPVAIELKRRLTGPVEAWRAVCQVTHMALSLAVSATPERMRSARRSCLSGRHGRESSGAAGSEPTVRLDAGWRRVVAAPVLDSAVVDDAAAGMGLADPPADARGWLAQRTSRSTATDRVVRRLAELPTPVVGVLAGPVEHYIIPLP